jgi:hypothetical protein
VSRTGLRALVLAAVLCVAAVAAAGCGGDESAEEQWANDFCSVLDEWRQDVEAAAESLANPASIDEETLDQAVQDAAAATDTLLDDLGELGLPETEARQEIGNKLEDLETVLRERANRARAALDQPADSASDALARLSTLASELAGAAQAVETTLSEIGELDPAGDLREAIESSEACQDLRERDEG